jgi:hypothetical protein
MVDRTNFRWPEPYFSENIDPELERYLSELIRSLRLFDTEIFSQESALVFETARIRPFVEVSTAYSMGVGDSVVLADASAATFAVQLPDPLEGQKKFYDIKKIDQVNSTRVSVEGVGQELPVVLRTNLNPSVTLYCDGTQYWII